MNKVDRAVVAAWIVTLSLPLTGAGAQTLTIDPSRLAIPAIVSTTPAGLVLAHGWPDSLRIYRTNWGSPMRLRVGVSNVRQVDDVRVLDKSSRPAGGFVTGFAALPLGECGSGSSACVEVSIRPGQPAPGIYRIAVSGGERVLYLSQLIEVVCNPFLQPVTLTLTPRERAVSEGAPITGRVRLGCPAMPPTLPANLVTVTNSDQPLGPTVVELRRPNFNQTEGLILNQELDIPDSIIVPPGMVEATFQITAPEHFPKFLQGWLHPPSVEAGITADLRRGSGGYASQSARFVYPRLGEVTLSGPVVGSRTVAGTVTLTQPTPMTEQVCFHVRDAGGRLAGASGHRFTVTSSGSTVPNCVDIPAGRTSGSFQVSAEVRTPVAYTLEGVRRHRHADGTLPVIDSAGTPIHAWPVPVVERVTVRQPPSSSVPPNPVVNVEKNGQVNGYVVLVNPAPPGGVTVDLLCKSSNPAGERLCGETVSLPERVTVREGVREAAFPIGVSRSSVEGSVMVMTSLEGREVGGPLYLELPPAFTLLDLVPAGQSNYRTLTIHLDGPVRAEPIQIALEVSGEGAAFLNVPATVVIPLGETMINVSVPVTRPVTKPLETTLTAVRVESKDMISATVVLQP